MEFPHLSPIYNNETNWHRGNKTVCDPTDEAQSACVENVQNTDQVTQSGCFRLCLG